MEQEVFEVNQTINQTMEPKKRIRRTKTEMEAAKNIEELAKNDNLQKIKEDQPIKRKSRLENYVYASKTIEALEVAFNTNKNIVLWGPGGHSKSTLSHDFLLEKGIDPFVVTMGKGMTIDRLFGGINLKKFQSDGKIEYLVENSFMNYEYVIFEELFDSPDYILERLKDVLSSKCLRDGGQVFPLKTKLIICNTNTMRENFTKGNSSLLALMERFPLELEVKWKDYNKITYENLLNTVKGFSDPMLTYILEEFAKVGNIISPRIALEAADVLEKCGPNCLDFIADFATKKDTLNNAIKKYKSIEKLMMFKVEIDNYVNNTKSIDLDSMTGKEIKAVLELHETFKKNLNSIKRTIVDDSFTIEKTDVQKAAESVFNIFDARVTDFKKTGIKEETNKVGEVITPDLEVEKALSNIKLSI